MLWSNPIVSPEPQYDIIIIVSTCLEETIMMLQVDITPLVVGYIS
ncbi:MAG: hypothetical protein AB2392_23220 [Neobacillus sp.]